MSDEIKEAYKSIRGEQSKPVTEENKETALKHLLAAKLAVEAADTQVREDNLDVAHKEIQKAHERLRNAARLLGFEPEIRKWEL